MGITADTDASRVTQLEHRLSALLAGGISSDIAVRQAASTDLLGTGAVCDLVVRPATVEHLCEAVTLIGQAGLAMVPRGGGLTYVGGYTPEQPGFVAIDLRDLNRIVDVSAEDMVITVEAGVTWQQIHAALKPLGLRMPFFGTLSGKAATVGGGLSNGALFLGTARHATAVESVVGLDVVLANGSLLRTGQLAVAKATRPFFRTFGPDTTGLFLHDCGAMGIKARASFRLIRAPAVTDYLSFGFADRDQAVAALSEIGRSEVAEDAYMLDPNKTRAALTPAEFSADARILAKVVGNERSLLRGLKAGVKLALAGRDFVEAGCYSLHLVLAGRTEAAVAGDVAAAREIAGRCGGRELPASIARAGRANIFTSLDAVLGPNGSRFVAVNCKVAHSQALPLIHEVEALIASYQPRLDAQRVEVSRLMSMISTQSFSYETMFDWHDSWLPLHRSSLSSGARDRLSEPAAAPDARALVMELRAKIVAVFADHGAASNQIGRTYPYASVLRPEARQLLLALKRELDPRGLMNPGVLELG